MAPDKLTDVLTLFQEATYARLAVDVERAADDPATLSLIAAEIEEAPLDGLDRMRLRRRAALHLEEISYYRENQHPRARGGRWRKKLGALIVAPGQPKGETGSVKQVSFGGPFQAKGPHGELTIRPTKKAAQKELKKMQAEPADKPYLAALDEPFTGDPWTIKLGRDMILSGEATTRDRWSTDDVNGEPIYDPERRAVHERIIAAMLSQDADGHPGKGQPHKSPKGRKPKVFFTGGAYASGKGAVVDGYTDDDGNVRPPHPGKPENAVVIDPDKIKALMPEFQQLTKLGDPEANLRVAEEAWDISQELAARVREQGLDVVVDGVGNTSVEEPIKRVKAYQAAGYEVTGAVYAATPTDVAIRNATARLKGAIKKGKTESIRYIPPEVMRDAHARVSKLFPEILKEWPGKLELWWTDTYNAEKGGFDPSIKILERSKDGVVTIYEQELYDRYLAKADEEAAA